MPSVTSANVENSTSDLKSCSNSPANAIGGPGNTGRKHPIKPSMINSNPIKI